MSNFVPPIYSAVFCSCIALGCNKGCFKGPCYEWQHNPKPAYSSWIAMKLVTE